MHITISRWIYPYSYLPTIYQNKCLLACLGCPITGRMSSLTYPPFFWPWGCCGPLQRWVDLAAFDHSASPSPAPQSSGERDKRTARIKSTVHDSGVKLLIFELNRQSYYTPPFHAPEAAWCLSAVWVGLLYDLVQTTLPVSHLQSQNFVWILGFY